MLRQQTAMIYVCVYQTIFELWSMSFGFKCVYVCVCDRSCLEIFWLQTACVYVKFFFRIKVCYVKCDTHFISVDKINHLFGGKKHYSFIEIHTHFSGMKISEFNYTWLVHVRCMLNAGIFIYGCGFCIFRLKLSFFFFFEYRFLLGFVNWFLALKY